MNIRTRLDRLERGLAPAFAVTLSDLVMASFGDADAMRRIDADGGRSPLIRCLVDLEHRRGLAASWAAKGK